MARFPAMAVVNTRVVQIQNGPRIYNRKLATHATDNAHVIPGPKI